MRSYIAALALPLIAFAGQIAASPLEQRQASSSKASATTTAASAALLETTVSGKLTTITMAVPTETPVSRAASIASSAASISATISAAAVSGDSSAITSATVTTKASNATATNLPLCTAPKIGPFCLPSDNTTVYVGQNYWITWDASVFAMNTTVTVALNYANNSNVAAWTSNGMPREQGFVVLTMNSDWLQGAGSRSLSFVMISYSATSNHAAAALPGPSVTLTTPGIAPPPPTKVPDLHSMVIGLPVALGGMILIVIMLFIGMKKHRQIDVLAILKKKTRRGGAGYGVGKSRRQRMGREKKGAIRLEEREIQEEGLAYRDDVESIDRIEHMSSPPSSPPRAKLSTEQEGWTTEKPHFEQPQFEQSQFEQSHFEPPQLDEPHFEKPRFPTHTREESLGSLVGDDETGERNAFRREMKAQEVRRLAGPIIPSGGAPRV